MSRFKGWTIESVERLSIIKKDKPKVKAKNKSNTYVDAICNSLDNACIEYVTEYKFLHDRRFRFDIALPKFLIAIEWEGGIFSNGRHTRGKGYSNDCKKYNLAVRHGWKLLRYTTEDAKNENWSIDIVENIKEMIK